MKNNQPHMRRKAERRLACVRRKAPHAEQCTDYGDRVEIRRVWARAVQPEDLNLYAAAQVFVVQREVLPRSNGVKASKELCYAISSAPPCADPQLNGQNLLQTFRGHWTVEAKNHHRRDVTYREDRSPVRNHNAARVLAAFKMMAIFLCQSEAHRPRCDRERTLPEFHRACALNGVDTAINWFKRKYNPLGR